uniref:Uncharacterized protein n=1 Tax=Terrapene triunguis TaxID=2587831 RepID=A0A674HWX0_9SAUR
MKVCGQCQEAGLLLQEVTMAGLHELRFTEEKPLLRGQDTELVSCLLSPRTSHLQGRLTGTTPRPRDQTLVGIRLWLSSHLTPIV